MPGGQTRRAPPPLPCWPRPREAESTLRGAHSRAGHETGAKSRAKQRRRSPTKTGFQTFRAGAHPLKRACAVPCFFPNSASRAGEKPGSQRNLLSVKSAEAWARGTAVPAAIQPRSASTARGSSFDTRTPFMAMASSGTSADFRWPNQYV